MMTDSGKLGNVLFKDEPRIILTVQIDKCKVRLLCNVI